MRWITCEEAPIGRVYEYTAGRYKLGKFWEYGFAVYMGGKWVIEAMDIDMLSSPQWLDQKEEENG